MALDLNELDCAASDQKTSFGEENNSSDHIFWIDEPSMSADDNVLKYCFTFKRCKGGCTEKFLCLITRRRIAIK